MPNHVLQLDCTSNTGDIELDLTSAPYSGAVSEIWAEWDVAFNSSWITAVLAQSTAQSFNECYNSGFGTSAEVLLQPSGGILRWVSFINGAAFPANTPYAPSPAIAANQFYHIKFHIIAGSPPTVEIWIDGVSIGVINTTGASTADIVVFDLEANGLAHSGALVYADNFILGTTEGGSDLASDDFESGGSSPSAAIWNSFRTAASTIIVDPGITPAVPPPSADSATVSSKTTPSAVENYSRSENTVVVGKTTLTGSYIAESFTIRTVDYDWNPWSTAYTFDGSIPIAGSVGAFDDDQGFIN